MDIRAPLNLNGNTITNLPEPTLASEPARKDHTHNPADISAIPLAQKGATSGVAVLDTNSKVLTSEMPIETQTIVITATHISNSSLNLSAECDVTKPITVRIITANGTSSPYFVYSVDFTIISRSILSWNGLGLANCLIASDSLEIAYYRYNA